ncbi:hypothetical protein RSAG8_10737, partial [Rhizoctonia solani AG-8 WAC10335]
MPAPQNLSMPIINTS